MKNRGSGTAQPKAFVVELSPTWDKWARSLSAAETEEIKTRLTQLQEGFGRPHIHAGLGIRRLSGRIFEFQASRALRVIFLVIKPNIFRLVMCGNHDQVRSWLKVNS